MKILPFDSRPDADALLGSSPQNERARDDMFSGLMRDMVNATQNDNIRPASGRTSSKQDDDNGMAVGNVTASAEMTIEDVSALRDELARRGVRQERLDELTRLASSGERMTLGKVLNALRGTSDGGAIGDSDKLQLKSLFQKLGLDDTQSATFLSELEAGNASNVWNALRRKMRAAGGDGISLEASEADALARALGISGNTLEALRKSFGGAAGATLDANGLQQLFAGVEQELTRREQQDKKLEVALGESLNPILQRLRSRQESADSANRLGSRNADQSEALMHDTFQRKTGGVPRPQDTPEEPQDGLSGKKDKGAHGKTYLEELLTRSSNRDSEKTARSSQGDAWDTMLRRIHVVDSNMQQSTTTQPAKGEAATLPAAPQQVLSQIEKGFLSGLQDGTRRMELRLDPAELGALSVVLTVRNGEVSAVIRPERAETAQLVNDHLHQLRQQLEQQGIKVERLEVQTQLSNNQNGSTWQGLDQHNQNREQQERSETIERMRRMAKLGGGDGAMAREMQFTGRAADSAAGLHLIA